MKAGSNPLLRLLLTVLALGATLRTQVSSAPPEDPGTNSEPLLIAENSNYRVSRLPLGTGATTKLSQRGHDTIVVLIGGLAELIRKGGKEPLPLKSGDVQFVPNGQYPAMSNTGSAAAQVLVIELKQHWDAEIRPCLEPAKCTRPIQMAAGEIGDTTSLFTNGYISAYRHRLAKGGTLTSTYFSARGKDHLLLVPLTDLTANFDGTQEKLKSGEAYASDATEVEVNAQQETRWVVIRVQAPKA